MRYQIEWYVHEMVVPWTEKGQPSKPPAYVKCGGSLWIKSDSEEHAIKRFMRVTNKPTTRCTIISTSQ